jgi:hypothetical protein
MHRVDAGGSGMLARAIISIHKIRKIQAVSIPSAVTTIVSGCKVVFIKAAPPNYIQVR